MNKKLAPLLHVENCSKSFSGTTVLDNVSIELYPGEVHCLVGENGAGKSTFIKILSGAYTPDCGNIYVMGELIKHFEPDVARKHGIQTIYQSQFLMLDLTVAENIYMGEYITSNAGLMDYRKQTEKARELLESMDLDIDPAAALGDLNISDRHSVQIARALAQDAKVLILDEPTASCGKSEKQMLLSIVRRIAKRGIGIIYISHHLDEVLEAADRVTVLRDGKKVSTYPRSEISERKLIKDMVGRETELFYKREKIEKGNEILEIRDFYKEGYLKKTSFKMQRGEILGFTGKVGAGRTELANLIFGAVKKDGGEMFIGDTKVDIHSPNQAIKNGVCLITEDRQRTGLFLDHGVGWNFISAFINKFKGAFIQQQKSDKVLNQYIDVININTKGVKQEVRYLSGGNQQKVVLAKWLHTDADVIIFDEPTKGIDIGAKEDVYKLIIDLARKGKFIIMISSDIPELMAMSDRVIIMKDRSIVADIAHAEISEESILLYSIGGQ